MANIYYVDPANGSNDNDGSAPDKALISPIKDGLDYGSYDDPAIFYFKRGTSFDVPGDGQVTTLILMSWPNSSDGDYWDNRPDDGKDWDDDDSDRAVIHFLDDSYFHLPDDSSDIISFRNITLLSDDQKDNTPAIHIKNSTVEFIDSTHSGDFRTGFVGLYEVNDDTELDYTVKIIRCEMNSADGHGQIIRAYEDEMYKFPTNIQIEDSVFVGWDYLIYFDINDLRIGESKINFLRSNIDKSDYFVMLSGDQAYGEDGGLVDFLIEDSKIKTNAELFRVGAGRDSRASCYKINLTILNSSLTSGNNILRDYTYRYDSSGYFNIVSKDSVFDGSSFLYKDNSGDDKHYDITVIGNEFRNFDRLFLFRGRPIIENIYMERNAYVSVDRLFDVSCDNTYMKNLFIKEDMMNVNEIIYGNWNEGAIRLTHSKIDGRVVDHGAKVRIDLFDVECGIIYSNGTLNAIACTIHQNGKFPVSVPSALIKGSVIDSPDYNIETITDVSMTFDQCDITSNFTVPTNTMQGILILNSKINDEDAPYLKLHSYQLRTVAAPHRVNGSTYSLMIDNAIKLRDPGLNELKVLYDENHTTIALYFAALQDIINDDYISDISCSFWVDDAVETSKMLLKVSDEDWDGLPDGYNLFEAYVDLGGKNLSTGDVISLSVSFSRIENKHLKLFIDPKLDNK